MKENLYRQVHTYMHTILYTEYVQIQMQMYTAYSDELNVILHHTTRWRHQTGMPQYMTRTENIEGFAIIANFQWCEHGNILILEKADLQRGFQRVIKYNHQMHDSKSYFLFIFNYSFNYSSFCIASINNECSISL